MPLGRDMSVIERIGQAAVERFDAWQNIVTGLGTWRDKQTAHKQVMSPPLPDTELEALYTDDDICARIIEELPRDALRSGFSIKLNADEVADATTVSRSLDDAFKDLHAARALRQAWIWGRLYGFGCVFVGADDGQDVSQPLNLDKVRTCTFLNVLRRTQLQAETWYEDIRSPKFGQAETYRLIVPPQARRASTSTSTRSQSGVRVAPLRTGSYGDIIVHESRLLQFRGVTTARYAVLSGQFWDDSVLQRVIEAVRQSSAAWLSTSHLMTDASQGVIKLQNLMQLLSSGGEALLRKRMQLFDMGRSVARAVMLDAEKESFERVATSFQGIPDLLDRFMMRIASAAHMPVTILFGRSPAGMNATGESDVRAWYDQVAAERVEELVPNIEHLTRIIMATDDGPTAGSILDGWCVEFPPLWQETKAERATGFKARADALVALANAHIILPEEAALSLAHSGDFTELDVETREEALKAELERMLEPPPEPPTNLPPQPLPNGGDDGDDPDDPTGDDPNADDPNAPN